MQVDVRFRHKEREEIRGGQMKITLKPYFWTYLLANVLFIAAILVTDDEWARAYFATLLSINGGVWATYSFLRILDNYEEK